MSTWPGSRGLLLSLALLPAAAVAQTFPTKQANAGDSISQGFDADNRPWDRPHLSWVQGTDSRVNSTYARFAAQNAHFVQESESVTGAELVGGGDNFPAQAARICAQRVKASYVYVLLGGNDVCNRSRSSTADPTANMYSVATWTNALRAGLDQLAECLPSGATVDVVSMPRVDFLYEAGREKSWWCGYGVWPVAGVCRIVTAETNATRRRLIGARVNAYNDAIRREVLAYDSGSNGRNPRRIHFRTDWLGSIEQGHTNDSVGTVRFRGWDLSGVDCFHPNVAGQSKLACTAWATNAYGSGGLSTCND